MAGQDKEVDFSNYFKNQQKNNKPVSKPKPSNRKPTNIRLIVMIIIMLGLAGALGYVLYQNSKGNVVTVPAGYRVVGNPARLEKIK